MADAIYTLNHTVPEELKRLEQNHWNLYLPLQDGRVVPQHISQHLKSLSNPRVADVGTGTGVWLRSMAQELPATARLDGFDPDDTKFPDPASFPKNIKLEARSALDEFPAELHGTYDLVHFRLQFFSWTKDGWPIAIRNAVNLLKPGGWLLWHEGGWSGWTSIPPSMAFYEYLGHEIERTSKMGREPIAAFKLRGWFRDAGLLDVDQEIFNILQDEKLHKTGADVLYTVCYQNALGTVQRGDFPGLSSKEYVDTLFAQVKKDFDHSLVSQEFRWVWGRKPGEHSSSESELSTEPKPSVPKGTVSRIVEFFKRIFK